MKLRELEIGVCAAFLLGVGIQAQAADFPTRPSSTYYGGVTWKSHCVRLLEATAILAITAVDRLNPWSGPFLPKGLSEDTLYSRLPIPRRSQELTITWVSHATTLIQTHGLNILTDPLFGDMSRFHRRQVRAFDPTRLPDIDVVLISHNHYDHIDAQSIRALLQRQPELLFLAPRGDLKLLRSFGVRNLQEVDWYDSVTVDQTQLTFVPSKHWSSRSIKDAYHSAWGAWFVQTPAAPQTMETVFFGGDAALDESLYASFAQRFGPIDVALLPIGPIAPRSLMRATHMDPYDSIRAFEILGARYLVPIHWGTYLLGPDKYLDSISIMRKWAELRKDHAFVELKFGESVRF